MNPFCAQHSHAHLFICMFGKDCLPLSISCFLTLFLTFSHFLLLSCSFSLFSSQLLSCSWIVKQPAALSFSCFTMPHTVLNSTPVCFFLVNFIFCGLLHNNTFIRERVRSLSFKICGVLIHYPKQFWPQTKQLCLSCKESPNQIRFSKGECIPSHQHHFFCMCGNDRDGQ